VKLLGQELKLLKTLHIKVVDGRQLALCIYEDRSGWHVYGVEVDGLLVCTGTKAEAKAYYGRDW